MKQKNIFKPKATGWIPGSVDLRDASWDKIFGATAEAAPPIFTRPVPDYIPFQDSINCCVWATLAAHQEYMSRQEGHTPTLSFRYGYGNTSGGTGGRSYRESAQWLKDHGIPEDKYCSNDWKVGAYNFLNVGNVTPEGVDDANNYRIKGFSFPSTNRDSLLRACLRQPIAIAIPGMDRDWSFSKDKIIEFTGDINNPDWWHSVLLWDWTENYNGILNWWGDRYRMLSLNYPVVSAMSMEDLPDHWRETNMFKLIQQKGSKDVWAVGYDKNRHLILNAETYKRGYEIGIWPSFDQVQQVDSLDQWPEGNVFIIVKSD